MYVVLTRLTNSIKGDIKILKNNLHINLQIRSIQLRIDIIH